MRTQATDIMTSLLVGLLAHKKSYVVKERAIHDREGIAEKKKTVIPQQRQNESYIPHNPSRLASSSLW